MKYIANYPIAEYRITAEMTKTSTFKEFVEVRSHASRNLRLSYVFVYSVTSYL
jgi:hypothetical protein